MLTQLQVALVLFVPNLLVTAWWAWRLPRPVLARGRAFVTTFAFLILAIALIFGIEVELRAWLAPRANLAGVVVHAASMATTEEVFKLVAFLIVRRRASAVSDSREWIRDGVLVGLAFSTIENAFFLARPVSLTLALLRLLLSTAGHPAYMSLMAWGAAKRRFGGRPLAALAGFAGAVLLHTAFDAIGLSWNQFAENDRPMVLIRTLQASLAYGTLFVVWRASRPRVERARRGVGLKEIAI